MRFIHMFIFTLFVYTYYYEPFTMEKKYTEKRKLLNKQASLDEKNRTYMKNKYFLSLT